MPQHHLEPPPKRTSNEQARRHKDGRLDLMIIDGDLSWWPLGLLQSIIEEAQATFLQHHSREKSTDSQLRALF